MSAMPCCEGCLEKLRKIDRLEQEVNEGDNLAYRKEAIKAAELMKTEKILLSFGRPQMTGKPEEEISKAYSPIFSKTTNRTL